MATEKNVIYGTSPPEAAPELPPPKLDLAALDGLRAVACAAVMSYHCFMYWGSLVDLDVAHRAIDAQPLLRLAMNGPAGVDVFLVLTGLWAAHALLPALEGAARGGTGATWQAIRSYYWKRAARLLPEYASTLLLLLLVDHSSTLDPALRQNHDTTFQYCLTSFPLNLVFLQNFVGFGTCGLVLWSLAVQVQFYLIFPIMALALRPGSPGFRGRVAIGAAALVVLGSMARLAAAHALGVRLPVTVINHPELDDATVGQTVAYYHSMYFSTPGRAVNLATGVLLGCLLLSPRALRALLARRRHLASASLMLAAVAWRVLGGLRFHGTASDPALAGGPALAALALHGSPLYSALAAATILGLMMRAGVSGRLGAWILRSRAVRGAAALSYNAYLLQTLAMFWGEAWLLPRGALAALAQTRPLACFGVILGGTQVATAVLVGVHAWAHARLASGHLLRWLR